jgi:hypothetical protein
MYSPERLISVIVDDYVVKLMKDSGRKGMSHFSLCAVVHVVGFDSQFIVGKQNKSFRS